MKKRFMSILMAAILLCTMLLLQSVSMAAGSYIGTVVGGWLRLRSDPDFNSETIASYKAGSVVTILGSTGSWYHVRTEDNLTGYMRSEYLEVRQGSKVIQGWIVCDDGVKVCLRSGPSTAYGVLTSLPNGQSVSILSEGATWSLIRVNNVKGYVMTRYLSRSRSPVDYADAWVTSDNGLGVRLRVGPGKGYDVIGVYSVGTEAKVLNWGSDWSRIAIGSRTGYMMTEFLTTTEPSPLDPTDADAYVYSENGLNVCLRSGPGTGYDIINSYAPGTPVRILKVGAVWDYVQIGPFQGYMMNQYLNLLSPDNRIISVLVSDSCPFVGETLTPVVTPMGATYRCEWYDNSKQLLGRSENLKVTNDMMGKKIRVRVTAYGFYSGTLDSEYTMKVTANPADPEIVKSVTIRQRETGSLDVGMHLTATVKPSGAQVTYVWERDDGTVVGDDMKTYTVTRADRGHQIHCRVVGVPEEGWTGYAESGWSETVGGGSGRSGYEPAATVQPGYDSDHATPVPYTQQR